MSSARAIYPISIMPVWLLLLAHINPLSYEVDLLRTLMLGQASANGIALDFGVLFAFTTLLILIGTRLYPRVAV